MIRETTGVQSAFKDEVLRDIVQLPQIEIIDLHEFDLESSDLSILSQATRLKTVRFYHCRLSDEKVAALKRLLPPN